MSRAMTSGLMLLVAGAVLGGAPRVAAAEDDLTELKLVIVRADVAVGAAMSHGDRAQQDVSIDPKLCFEAVDKLAAAGTSPTEVLHGRTEFLFKRAKDRCEEYRRWRALVDGAVVLAGAAQQFWIASQMEPGTVSDQFIGARVAEGKACAAGVERVVAAGAPLDVAVKVQTQAGEAELTLSEGRDRWCEGLLAWGKDYKHKNDQARAAAAKAVRDKYARAGIGGDRLRLFVEYDDVYWRGKGCEVVDDLGRLKQATVLFHWLQNGDGTHTIRRYQFKKDKLVKTSSRTFKTEAAAYRGCK